MKELLRHLTRKAYHDMLRISQMTRGAFQMSIQKLMKILRVVYLMREMPVGEGWVTGNDMHKYSGVSYPTTYRYLKKMEYLKLIESRNFKRGKIDCKEYRITEKGREMLNSQGDMFIVS